MASMDKQPTPHAGKGDCGPDDKGHGTSEKAAKIPMPRNDG